MFALFLVILFLIGIIGSVIDMILHPFRTLKTLCLLVILCIGLFLYLGLNAADLLAALATIGIVL
ncbi:hypothetical protein [Allobaculum mucilyticum]|uniref:hypothetical protein n=1 Tax=Allobaculum mucilyticum TaxID=2834459 RepID=UPI001E5C5DF4|nr:hypothetical protein [Allobaculum mucilyticum]UNT96252.1 hypothetical protein KWG62_00355 [Allobaculum mucilyticum]